jgi:hypothetical protein
VTVPSPSVSAGAGGSQKVDLRTRHD